MSDSFSSIIANFLILGAPFLLIRFFLGSYFPGAIAGIVPLILWYGIGIGCASLSARMDSAFSFYLYIFLTIFLLCAAVFSTIHYGLSWKQALIAFAVNGYTWICALYYGGLVFTHKFD